MQIAGAQNCSETLDKAQKLYESGMIEEIPQMLTPCINKGFSPDERLQANKLLILSYLFDQNLEEADKSMLNFLKDYPEYKLNPTDPAEFAQLFKSYRVIRVFSIGAVAGGNLSYPWLLKNYATNSQNLYGKYSNANVGYEGGVALNFYLASALSLNLELYYFTNSFAYLLLQPDVQNIHSKETQTKLELPVTLTYDFGHHKIRPYLRIGGSLDYLIKASDNKTLSISSQNVNIRGSGINVTSERQQFNYNGIVGGGIKYKTPEGFIFFDVRWKQGLLNQVVTNNRYQTESAFIYQNPDDNFTLNNLIFSVGYMHSFFKAKKKKST
jgi:hypothetical protein